MFRALKKNTARREITAHLCLVTKQNKKTIKKEDLAHDRFNIYLIMNAVETLLNSPDSQYSFHILYPPVNLLLKHDVGSLIAFPLHWKSESSDKGYFNNCILVMAWPFHLLPLSRLSLLGVPGTPLQETPPGDLASTLYFHFLITCCGFKNLSSNNRALFSCVLLPVY